MARMLLLLATLLVGSVHAQTLTDRCAVHFASDDDRVDAGNDAALIRFLSGIDPEQEATFIVEGHTDLDGENAYNEALALRRANAVRTRLIEAGAAPASITLRTYGERRPAAFGKDDDDKERNRRVEVTCARTVLRDLDALDEALGAGERTRTIIDAARVNYVAGHNGTVVRIPANALTDASGRIVSRDVEITLTEALTIDRMIAEKLSTTAEGRILETGGMMRIEARGPDGGELRLRAGDSLLVALPTDAQAPGMQLFVSMDGSDWSATGQEPLPALPKADLPPQPWLDPPIYDRPVYKEDMALRPRRPVGPMRPDPPIPPRRESYSTTPRWYQFHRHARLRARDELNYREAMERHAERLEKYADGLRRYEEEGRRYPAAKKRYIADSVAYHQRLTADMDEFYRTVVAGADSLHEVELTRYHRHYDALIAAWRERCDAYMRSYGDRLDSLGLASTTNQLSQYVFTVNNLGWINCDRFLGVPATEKRDLIVQDPDVTDERVYVVFKNINSLVAMRRDEQGGYITNGIPRNEPAELVAYKVEDGKALLCRQPVRWGQRMALEFKPARIADVREAIQTAGTM